MGFIGISQLRSYGLIEDSDSLISSAAQVDANELLAVPPGTEVEMTPRDI